MTEYRINTPIDLSKKEVVSPKDYQISKIGQYISFVRNIKLLAAAL